MTLIALRAPRERHVALCLVQHRNHSVDCGGHMKHMKGGLRCTAVLLSAENATRFSLLKARVGAGKV